MPAKMMPDTQIQINNSSKGASSALIFYLCTAVFNLCFSHFVNADERTTNSWHTYNDSEVVFVFVHGIFSNPTDCWTAENSIFWPDLVAQDGRFMKPSVYLGGYYTNFSSGSYSIPDAANELLGHLKNPDTLNRKPPLSKSKIVFVAHSTGGVVVRYMLERQADVFKDKVVGLVLLASPSRGSEWSNRLGWLNRFFRNKMGSQLERDNDLIMDLDSRFADLVSSRKIEKLAGIDAYENKFIIPGFFFNSEFVVDASASSSYFGSHKIIPNSDHFSIAKPTSARHASHQLLWEFFNERFRPLYQADAELMESKAFTFGPERKHANSLPIAFITAVAQARGSREYYRELSTRGNLTLNGTEIIFEPDASGGVHFLSANELRLTNGAKIVTNGVNLVINVSKLDVISGSIVAFLPSDRTAASGSSAGAPGLDGLDGGKVELVGILDIVNRIAIDLTAQNGGDGTPGHSGRNGMPGRPGISGSDSAFGCRRGPGNGEPGEPGGDGEPGGRSGNGGDGGTLVLATTAESTLLHSIDFSANAGSPGKPGTGGLGGKGGSGGPRGSQTLFCRGGNNGPDGADGKIGAAGEMGDYGAPGKVMLEKF